MINTFQEPPRLPVPCSSRIPGELKCRRPEFVKVMPFLPLYGGKTKAGHFHQFHTYHNVGGNHVGIIADRFNEEHLGSKAKLS